MRLILKSRKTPDIVHTCTWGVSSSATSGDNAECCSGIWRFFIAVFIAMRRYAKRDDLSRGLDHSHRILSRLGGVLTRIRSLGIFHVFR